MRSDFAEFARRCNFELTSRGRVLARNLSDDTRYIALRDAEPSILMLIACWRAACWPRSITAIVTPSKDHAIRLLDLASSVMSFAEHDVRQRVLFLQNNEGIICGDGSVVNVIHCQPGQLGLEIPLSREIFTILVPDMNRVPGCHLKYLTRYLSRPETCLLVNSTAVR